MELKSFILVSSRYYDCSWIMFRRSPVQPSLSRLSDFYKADRKILTKYSKYCLELIMTLLLLWWYQFCFRHNSVRYILLISILNRRKKVFLIPSEGPPPPASDWIFITYLLTGHLQSLIVIEYIGVCKFATETYGSGESKFYLFYVCLSYINICLWEHRWKPLYISLNRFRGSVLAVLSRWWLLKDFHK